MRRVYEIDLTASGIAQLQAGLKEYEMWFRVKTDELCAKLADLGATRAEVGFAAAYYDGAEDHMITVEPCEGGYRVKASGTTVLFVEFGAGLIGGGHPEENGMSPGSYSDTVGKGHWDDPNGWWYAHGRKSHGNPANMPMYNAKKEIEMELGRVVREVFAL